MKSLSRTLIATALSLSFSGEAFADVKGDIDHGLSMEQIVVNAVNSGLSITEFLQQIVAEQASLLPIAVSALISSSPADAANITAQAVRLLPDFAVQITNAAVSSLPEKAAEITLAALTEAPVEFSADISDAAKAAAPGQLDAINEATIAALTSATETEAAAAGGSAPDTGTNAATAAPPAPPSISTSTGGGGGTNASAS